LHLFSHIESVWRRRATYLAIIVVARHIVAVQSIRSPRLEPQWQDHAARKWPTIPY